MSKFIESRRTNKFVVLMESSQTKHEHDDIGKGITSSKIAQSIRNGKTINTTSSSRGSKNKIKLDGGDSTSEEVDRIEKQYNQQSHSSSSSLPSMPSSSPSIMTSSTAVAPISSSSSSTDDDNNRNNNNSNNSTVNKTTTRVNNVSTNNNGNDQNNIPLQNGYKSHFHNTTTNNNNNNTNNCENDKEEVQEEEDKEEKFINELVMLEKQTTILKERCQRLEAQSILVSVQQLDLLAKGISRLVWYIILTIYWYSLYKYIFPNIQTCTNFIIVQVLGWFTINNGKHSSASGGSSIINYETEITTTNFDMIVQNVSSVLVTWISNMSSTNGYDPLNKKNTIDTKITTNKKFHNPFVLIQSCFRWIRRHFIIFKRIDLIKEQQVKTETIKLSSSKIAIVVLLFVVKLLFEYGIKLFLIVLSSLHHRMYHGLLYRRIEVFTVFFIVLIRTRSCRWRESMFLINPPTTTTNTTNTTPSETTSTTTTTTNNTTTTVHHHNTTTNTIKGYGEEITEDSIWDANYEISARFLYVSILRLRGLWTKTAQYLSSRADFMPNSYIRELKRLQDEAPETNWNTIVDTIPSYILQSITNVNTKPLASASIGQVHTCTLIETNEPIVLKIQHPFASTLLYDDFYSLSIICRIISLLEPDYKFIEILMKEWSKEAIKELDFTLECQNLIDANHAIETMKKEQQQQQILRNNGLISYDVEIPYPIIHLCTKHILVMSYCDGVRIDDFDTIDHQWHINRTDIVTAVVQTFAYMMYCTNIFNGDPHVGNLKIRQGTSGKPNSSGNNNNNNNNNSFTIILLDWGLTKRFTCQQRLAFCQMVYSAATIDYGMLLDSFHTIGLQMKRENILEDMEGIRFLLREMVPQKQSRKRIKAKIKTDMKRMNERPSNEKVPMEAKAYPGEFFFFVRVNELLHGLGSKFHIHLHYLNIIHPYAEYGLKQLLLLQHQNTTTYHQQPNDSISTSETESATSINHNNSPIKNHINGQVPKDTPGSDSELENKVRNVITYLQSQNHIDGVQVAVLDSNGNHVVNVVDGHLGGLKKDIPMTSNTLILGFSCTKAITSTLAHIMVKEGYLTYDEPVCERVWTQFCPTHVPPVQLYSLLQQRDNINDDDIVNQRWEWKRQITLRHMLTHTAGFASILPIKLSVKRFASCEECIKAYECHVPIGVDDDNKFVSSLNEVLLPTTCPGTEVQYHALSFGWIVAGTLIGAYNNHHRQQQQTKKTMSNDVVTTFHDVYNAILVPKLSKDVFQYGFYPFGVSSSSLSSYQEAEGEDKNDDNDKVNANNFPIALTTTDDVSISRLIQLKKDAEAMGETLVTSNETNDSTNHNNNTNIRSVLETFHGKEFLLDPRIWNCTILLTNGNVPAAGGRFTATSLAKFYNTIGTIGHVFDETTFQMIVSTTTLSSTATTTTTTNSNNNSNNINRTRQSRDLLQGQTDMSSPSRTKDNNNNSNNNSNADVDNDDNNQELMQMGFGYQLITTNTDKIKNKQQQQQQLHYPSAFGHAGVGGSIGFYHIQSKMSVAVMLNKADAPADTAKAIVMTIANHFNW